MWRSARKVSGICLGNVKIESKFQKTKKSKCQFYKKRDIFFQ